MVTYPYEWKELSFKKTINSVPFNIYLKQPRISGEFIVVQQGDSPIAGYANGSPYRDYKKVVLFGDHTLSLYKPSTPFFVATDGIRILSCKENIDRDYLYYFLQKYKPESEGYKRHFSILLRMDVFLPELSEQQAIASVLSDFDEHIDNLSELIEKKKAIRDGALEDLLSGRTRLDGFSGEWIESTIEDSTKEIITGGTPSTTVDKYWGGSIPWLASTEIHQKIITRATKNITKIGLNNSSAKMAPKDSVLIALAGQGKTRGTAAFLAYPMALNQSLAALVAADETDSKFLYYLIENMYLELRELSSGDGGRGGLNKTLIKNINIRLPREIKEQHAIAEVLTAMDEEIESLKIEKEKMIQIKEGAMDDLLTGRVRLKV